MTTLPHPPSPDLERARVPSPRPRAAREARTLLGLLRGLATSRLVQFVVLGGALLLASPAPERAPTIALRRASLAALTEREAELRGRPVDDALAAQVLARQVEDELLVREARRLGLDQDDAILRRRLIQKVLFLAEDLGGASRPLRESELRAYFDQHRAAYQVPARARFRQIFGTDAAQVQAWLPRARAASAEDAEATPALGEASLLDHHVDADQARLEHELGASFTRALRELPRRRWSGPVASRLGYHLIFLEELVPGHAAELDEVRERVTLDAVLWRRQRAVARFFEHARRRYRVELDGQPIAPAPGEPRAAAHFAASQED